MENDVQEYRHVILDMCLHNRAVDYFFEGTHASYLHKLLGRLTDRDFYADHILASLADAGDDQDAVHRFFLARLLAQDGNPRARGLMYQYFCPGKAYGETIAMDFVEMDGLEGLRFVASKIPNPIAGGTYPSSRLRAIRRESRQRILRPSMYSHAQPAREVTPMGQGSRARGICECRQAFPRRSKPRPIADLS